MISRMDSAVHRGLEYLIPLLEFARLQQAYLDIKHKREQAKEEGKGRALIMPVRQQYRAFVFS